MPKVATNQKRPKLNMQEENRTSMHVQYCYANTIYNEMLLGGRMMNILSLHDIFSSAENHI